MENKSPEELVEYYEGLIDFLDDHVASLVELIDLYNEELEGEFSDGV